MYDLLAVAAIIGMVALGMVLKDRILGRHDDE